MTAIVDLKSIGGAPGFLALNNRFAAETSFLEPEDWAGLLSRSWLALAVADNAGFLLAFDRKPTAVSPNFDWFAERGDGFVYIDRVVIDPAFQGRGTGRALYLRLFEAARDAGFGRVVCEVNLDPPNLVSLAFHQRMGFEAVGETRLENGKEVRYFVLKLWGGMS